MIILKTNSNDKDYKLVKIYFYVYGKYEERLQFKCERFGNNKPKLTFFKRINYRKGRATAISATARKLAVIIWSMLYKGQDNNPSKEYLYLDQKRKLKRVNKI